MVRPELLGCVAALGSGGARHGSEVVGDANEIVVAIDESEGVAEATVSAAAAASAAERRPPCSEV